MLRKVQASRRAIFPLHVMRKGKKKKGEQSREVVAGGLLPHGFISRKRKRKRKEVVVLSVYFH